MKLKKAIKNKKIRNTIKFTLFLLITFLNINADQGKVCFTNKTNEMLFSIKYSKTGSKTMTNWTKRIGPKNHTNDGFKSSRTFKIGNFGRDIDKLKIKVYWDKDGNGKGIYKGEFEISLKNDNNIKIKNNKTSEVFLKWSAKNKKPIITFKRTKDDKTVSFSKSFKAIIEKGSMLYLHNESPTKTMKFTIPNLDNDQKKPNELTLKPNKSGKIEIGERVLGQGAHDVQLKIDVYQATNFEGTFEWNDEINIKKGKITHVFFKWNPNKTIHLRRKIYKATQENNPKFLTTDLIKQNYGHTAGGMGVVNYINKTKKPIRIYSTIRESGAFAPNILIDLKAEENRSLPTGNKDNDIKDMVGLITGQESKARYWSKNVIVKEGKTSSIIFDLNNNGDLYRYSKEAENFFDALERVNPTITTNVEREYGKKYSPGITYRIHNNSGKDISLEIRYSDLAKGAKIGGIIVGVIVLTIVAYYATLAMYSSFIGSLTSTQLATISGIASEVGGSGLLHKIAATAAYKAVIAAGSKTTSAIATGAAQAAVNEAILLAGGSASGIIGAGTHLTNQTFQALNNINALNSKIGFIGEIKNNEKLIPETIGSKTSNGFIVALPKNCTFWGFNSNDIHDIKVTSYINENKIYYDDQHEFKIYKEFHPNNNTFSKLKYKDSKKINIKSGGDEITEIRINPDFSVYASKPIEKKDYKDSNGNNYYKNNGFYADKNILQKLNLI